MVSEEMVTLTETKLGDGNGVMAKESGVKIDS